MKNTIIYSLSNIVYLLLGMLIMLNLSSCKKQDDWLNIKSTQNAVTPATLKDYQAVLDNTVVMNTNYSVIGLLGSDNLYIPDANLNGLDALSRNAYLWTKDIYQGATSSDWLYAYQMVEYANIVLDGLGQSGSGTAAYNNVKGSALFYRSYGFYQLSQLFCKPYLASSAGTDPGIPVRLSSDVNEKSLRGTVQQTYTQMIGDLQQAVSLLPQTPLYTTRPSSTAACALLAKIYLSMGDYVHAGQYADKALQINSRLIDYNTLNPGTANPFPTFAKGNPEIIFYAYTYALPAVYSSSAAQGRINPALLQSYEDADLRKSAFFIADGTTGLYKFKGSYSAQAYDFSGIANDELYLIRAECNARTGNPAAALTDLNKLLKNRYLNGAFQPVNISVTTDLINRIILERRKELPFTANLRWEDLRRLNQDPVYALTLTRSYGGATYTLLPNSNFYTLPIPDDEINLDGLQQNPR